MESTSRKFEAVKHTPGPWESGRALISNQWRVFQPSDERGGKRYSIAIAVGDNAEANAALIAAAPETAAERDNLLAYNDLLVSQIDSLKASNAELLETFEFLAIMISYFYTATRTNAKSRDENRDYNKLVLETIRATIAKHKGGEDGA